MNINEYLTTENGNKSFEEVSYNELDALVFSTIAYLPLDSCIENNGEVSLKKVMEAFCNSDKYNEMLNNNDVYDVLRIDMIKKLINNERYKDVKILNFRDRGYIDDKNRSEAQIKKEDMQQFAAITFKVGDDIVISYRGTDGSLKGWYEDFAMSYTETAAQESARKYLEEMSRNYSGNIYLTGHSKGGNNALYASLTVDPKVQDKIKSVINFDGPAFSENVVNKYKESYERIKGKWTTYSPQTTIISLALGDHENQKFIYSNENHIFQHDSFSWQIDENGNFIPSEQDELSKYIDSVLNDALENLTNEEREILFTFIFTFGGNDVTSLGELGQAYIDYLSTNGYFSPIGIIKAVYDWNNLDKEKKDFINKVLSSILVALWSNKETFEGVRKFEEKLQEFEKVFKERIEIMKNSLINFIQENEILPANKFSLIVNSIKKLTKEICENFIYGVNKLLEYLRRHTNQGYRNLSYIQGEMFIKDILLIHSLAERLNNVQKNIISLDRDLDDLRRSLNFYELVDKSKVGLIDLFAVKYDNQLTRCINYLNSIYSELEYCERRLIEKTNSI